MSPTDVAENVYPITFTVSKTELDTVIRYREAIKLLYPTRKIKHSTYLFDSTGIGTKVRIRFVLSPDKNGHSLTFEYDVTDYDRW